MRSVTYSMGVSLDGYIVGPDGGFDWTVPDEVFRFWIDEIREVGVHVMGRRLYETNSAYRRKIEECDQIVRDCAGWSLIDALYCSTSVTMYARLVRIAACSFSRMAESVSSTYSWVSE